MCHQVLLFFFFSLLLPTHLPPPSCTHAQSCNPMDFSPPDSSFLGFFQARILEWVAISFSIFFFCNDLGQTFLHVLEIEGAKQCAGWPATLSYHRKITLWATQTLSFSCVGSWREREGNTDLKGSHSIFKIRHLTMLVASQPPTLSNFP